VHGELLLGHRPVGRPKLRYSDHIKSVLRKCNIPESDLEVLAEDRELWSSTCATGLKSFKAASKQAAMAIVALADTLLLRLLQLDLSAITDVAKSVRRTSVSAVISVFIYDRTTDITSVQRHHRNRLITTSKQANKQASIVINLALAHRSLIMPAVNLELSSSFYILLVKTNKVQTYFKIH